MLRQKTQLMQKNTLRKVREARLMSKTELARTAGVSPITISRIENGLPCRMATQRKIILALGLKLSDKRKIFKD
jgi:DNA-binding XRE family transcriptional regulator